MTLNPKPLIKLSTQHCQNDTNITKRLYSESGIPFVIIYVLHVMSPLKIYPCRFSKKKLPRRQPHSFAKAYVNSEISVRVSDYILHKHKQML